MGWKTRLTLPSLAAIGYLVASFFAKIVPCQVSANIPNPSFTWSLCTLNPDKALFGVREMYWGISTQLTDAYLLSLLIVFICFFLFILPFARHSQGHSKSKENKSNERRFETY